MTYLEALKKEVDSLENDEQRWFWVLNNQDKDILVNLDNDDTFVTYKGELLIVFSDYLGWSDGVFTLLGVVGIKATGV